MSEVDTVPFANIPIVGRVVRWFLLLKETIVYIRTNGWKEYKKARKRYDRHQEALKNLESRYTKKGEIRRNKQIAKARKR